MIWQLHAVAGLGVHPMNTPFAHLDRSIHQLRRRSAASRHSTPRPRHSPDPVLLASSHCDCHRRGAISFEGLASQHEAVLVSGRTRVLTGSGPQGAGYRQ